MADGGVDLRAERRVIALALLADILAHPRTTRAKARRAHDLLAGEDGVAAWALEAQRFVNACGCSTSAALALATAPLAALSVLLQPSDTPPMTVVKVLGLLAGGFVAGAVVGKILGLWGARRRFRARTRDLIGRLTAAPPIKTP